MRKLERGYREAGHLFALRGGHVVPAQQVQKAVDGKQGELAQWLVPELGGLADNRLPRDGEVADVLAWTPE
jgi:hypothetical protein